MILTLEAATADELRSKIVELAKVFNCNNNITYQRSEPATEGQLELPLRQASEEIAEENQKDAATPAPAKRGRKPKAQVTETQAPTETVPAAETTIATAEAPVETKPAATESPELPTKDRAEWWLREVYSKNKEKAVEILKHLGVKRLPDLKPESYPRLIAICQDAVEAMKAKA